VERFSTEGDEVLKMARSAVRMAVGRARCCTCGEDVGPWLNAVLRLSSVDPSGLEAKRRPVLKLVEDESFDEVYELRDALEEHAVRHPGGFEVELRAPGSWRGAQQVEGEPARVEGR
jgi:hypothetical protein